MKPTAKLLRELVQKNLLEEACEALIQSPLAREGYNQASRLTALQERIRTGQLTNSDINVETNQIRYALLNAADKLEKANISQTSPKKIWPLLIVISFCIGAGYIFQKNIKSIPRQFGQEPNNNTNTPDSLEQPILGEKVDPKINDPESNSLFPKDKETELIPKKQFKQKDSIEPKGSEIATLPKSENIIIPNKKENQIERINPFPKNPRPENEEEVDLYFERKEYVNRSYIFEPDSFYLGDSLGNYDQKPQYLVQLSGFRIGKKEVSCAQYVEFLNDLSLSKTEALSLVRLTHISYNKKEHTYSVKPGLKNKSISGISWEGAKRYCKWTSNERLGNGRLPTEAEWEYAASQGVFHLESQLAEWCEDFYQTEYNSKDIRNPKGPWNGEYKVVRGGVGTSQNAQSRIKHRKGIDSTTRSMDVGCRCVWSK